MNHRQVFLLNDAISNIVDLLDNTSFIQKFKTNPQDFVRARKISFRDAVLLPCFFPQSNLQSELTEFYSKLNHNSLLGQTVDKTAYSHARKKYTFKVFEALNDQFLGDTKELATLTFHGFVVLGIDGSTTPLPRSKALTKAFSFIDGNNGRSKPTARISCIFDCLNKISHHSQIVHYRIGERELASRHIDHIKLTDNHIITLDRGYDAAWMFHKITDAKGHYCARMTTSSQCVKEFLQESCYDKIVTIKLAKSRIEKCRLNNIQATTITYRLVKIELDSGEIEVLATSLFDDKFDRSFFKELYSLRWQTEENYKVIKTRIKIGKFMSKSIRGILQEFYGRMFMLNVTSVMRIISDQQIEKKVRTKPRKHKIKTNFKAALTKVRKYGVALFTSNSLSQRIKYTTEIINQFTKDIVEIVNGRHFPRNIARKKPKISQSYTSI